MHFVDCLLKQQKLLFLAMAMLVVITMTVEMVVMVKIMIALYGKYVKPLGPVVYVTVRKKVRNNLK